MKEVKIQKCPGCKGTGKVWFLFRCNQCKGLSRGLIGVWTFEEEEKEHVE